MTDLIKFINKGEDSKTQFKLRFNSIDALAAEIAAMANSEGGIILTGISDSGEIVGIKDLQRLNQLISNACSQKIEPPHSVITENIVIDNKLVVLIKIPKGSNKPYAVNKSDFWIKVGADKRRASREELRRLMQASGTLYADEMSVENTGIDDLDMYSFQRFYEDQYGKDIEGLSIEKILSNLKILKNNNLTLAGVLLFAKHPEILKPQYVVKAVSFAGNDIGGTEYLDSEDLRGPLPVVFKSGMAFLKRNLRKQQKARSFNQPGIMEIPEIALEEAFVNALIHRDYFINSGIRLFVFDNRIEIISPGKLPNTVTTENIKHGIQIVRNPLLLSFASKLEIPYRGIGSGIIRMLNECRKAEIAEPELIEDRDSELFKVIFFRGA
ncbi:putative transcriptional regulator [Candidatus Magnetomoraceae bacterium gMMP-1]